MLLGVSALALTACHRELPGIDANVVNPGIVKFAPTVADADLSKAGLDIDGGAITKGTLINNNDKGDKSDIALAHNQEFYVTAWTGTTKSIAGSKVEYKAVTFPDPVGVQSYWTTVDGGDQVTEYIWKNGETKTFYAYANLPASGASVESTTNAGQTLSYTVPASSADQTDILLGTYQGTGSGTGTASIRFVHPLTSVRFVKGNVSEGVTITGISIEGVYPAGKATQGADGSFSWTKNDGNPFTAADDETLTVSIADATEAGGYLGDALLLIPQTFASTSKARLKVVVDYKSSDVALYYPLSGAQWKASYTNTYAINFIDGCDLSIVELDEYIKRLL